jgi:predicted nucleotidyltransferase
MLDIIPFGNIAKPTSTLYWPPDESVALSVLGFEEVYLNSIHVELDNDATFKVATLAGLAILKLIAWNDRFRLTTKDAEDFGFILKQYYSINMEKSIEFYDEIYTDEFSELIAAGQLLGKDISSILRFNSQARNTIIQLIEHQLLSFENSPLLNQIIETNSSITFDELYSCLSKLVKELK